MMQIEQAPAGPALDEVRTLMREFLAWHLERHASDLHLVQSYFDAAAFEAELAGLPGAYAPPAGRLLLARWQGESAGCVALKPLAGGGCEMKRMFVRPALQGRGIGRALATTLLDEARRAGHEWMQLDTSIRQEEAAGLYRSLGFREVPAPETLAGPLRDWLVFMRRDLRLSR
ncbi:GNAT family N-acetyltransferase [Ideonella sp. YS5]|uniref:GNAT family N-acetyltransferase n=1 Tax=Ideonella sp. YS5 TaxID=3453714 RepID=UPI003EE9F860